LRGLKGSIPRGFKDHRRRIARRYAESIRDLTERLKTVPGGARPLLREYGRLTIQLEFLNDEHDRVVGLRRLSEARRLRGELKVARFLLLKLQRQIEHLAGLPEDSKAADPLDVFFSGEEAGE
jgi:hypothetical protein